MQREKWALPRVGQRCIRTPALGILTGDCGSPQTPRAQPLASGRDRGPICLWECMRALEGECMYHARHEAGHRRNVFVDYKIQVRHTLCFLCGSLKGSDHTVNYKVIWNVFIVIGIHFFLGPSKPWKSWKNNTINICDFLFPDSPAVNIRSLSASILISVHSPSVYNFLNHLKVGCRHHTLCQSTTAYA